MATTGSGARNPEASSPATAPPQGANRTGFPVHRGRQLAERPSSATLGGMSWLASPPLEVYRRRDSFEVNEYRLRRLLDSGQLQRIAPGSFVQREKWDAASPLVRHAQRAWEAAARLTPGAIFANAAAAALAGIDLLGDWPTRVEVAVAESTGGRATHLIQRRSRRYPVTEVIPWGRHFVTVPARTVLDIAASRPFADGVAAMDQALWEGRRPKALLTLDELRDAAAAFVGRGALRARRAADFALPGAANVRESQSRVLIDALGFPPPVIQHRFVLRSGRVAYPDFWWPDYRVLGELDGMQKYFDEEMLAGRTPKQALADEKDREDELRREVGVVARWRVKTLERPAMLWDILSAAGLPSSLPRPGR